MHEASDEPEKSLGASNIGAEQDKDKSSEVPEQTETPLQQQDQQPQDQQQQDQQKQQQQARSSQILRLKHPSSRRLQHHRRPCRHRSSSPPRTSSTKKRPRSATTAEAKASAQNPERQMVTHDAPGALLASAEDG